MTDNGTTGSSATTRPGKRTAAPCAAIIVDKRHTTAYNCLVKTFEWDEDKNALLRRTRGVSFEDVVFHIEQGDVLDITGTHDPGRYPGQRHFVLNINGYVHNVPFVEDDEKIFLKTIIPSRKHDKRYKGGDTNET